MTLGPDRRTVFRWMTEPFYQTADPPGGGGTETKSGETDAGGEKPKADADSGKQKTEADDKTAGKSKAEALTLEHEGRRYVLQDYVDTVASKARDEGKKAGRTEVEEEARRKALEESGNFKELYEKELAQREKLESELAASKLTELRQKVGTKHGLSQKLIDRLVGSNEAELEADAKELAKELGVTAKDKDETKKPAPKTEGGSNGKVRSGSGNEAEEKKRPAKTFRFQTPNDVSWNS